MSKYLPYVKEINDFIDYVLEKEEKTREKIEHYYFIKSYIYYFGFKDIVEQNLQKSLELMNKGLFITDEIYSKRRNHIYKYNIIKTLNKKKLISDDELIKEKKNIFKFYYDNLSMKYELIDCYIVGKDFYEGFTRKKMNFFLYQYINQDKIYFVKLLLI